MSDKNIIPLRIEKDIRKLARRKMQDIGKGIDKPGYLFPTISHVVGKEDMKGCPDKLGEVRLNIRNPRRTSALELKVGMFFLKRYQKWLIGKKLPQKRVRPQYDRDRELAKSKITTQKSRNESTIHRPMDDIVFKETENITDTKEFSEANKRARKRYIQAKYRFNRSTKK